MAANATKVVAKWHARAMQIAPKNGTRGGGGQAIARRDLEKLAEREGFESALKRTFNNMQGHGWHERSGKALVNQRTDCKWIAHPAPLREVRLAGILRFRASFVCSGASTFPVLSSSLDEVRHAVEVFGGTDGSDFWIRLPNESYLKVRRANSRIHNLSEPVLEVPGEAAALGVGEGIAVCVNTGPD